MSNLGVWRISLQFLGSVFAKGTPQAIQAAALLQQRQQLGVADLSHHTCQATKPFLLFCGKGRNKTKRNTEQMRET